MYCKKGENSPAGG
jgi:hypothetical protein